MYDVQVLTGAMGRNQRRLFDGYQEIADFADQILNKTNLAWSVHVAGGNSYKCSIYQQSNASQMCITTVDMLKAALLSSKDTLSLLHFVLHRSTHSSSQD